MIKTLTDDITDFLMENTTYTSRETIADCIDGHIAYNTFSLITDEKGIAAYCRWNYPVVDTALILDLVIRKDVRKKGLIRKVIEIGMRKFPKSKYIMFERGYDDGLQQKKVKKYKITDFLKRRFLGC